jgi:hypothetical protein
MRSISKLFTAVGALADSILALSGVGYVPPSPDPPFAGRYWAILSHVSALSAKNCSRL